MTISPEELQLAARNHGMPLEALRWELTPVGLHYLLVHYDIPVVDADEWRLSVTGERSLSLSLADLQARETVSLASVMECAGNGRARLEPRPVSQPWLLEAVGNAEWTGTPLAALLAEAGVPGDACEVLFTGLDRGVEGGQPPAPYARSLPLAEAMGDGLLLAWAINGQPLPPQHGFPLRLVVPGWYGMTNVKWLSRIEFLRAPWDGYQNAVAYRFRKSEDDRPGRAVTRMEPRALMVPPGVPDFMSRRRFVQAGPVAVEGRAWSGFGPIASVELGVDGGFAAATVEPAPGPHAWQRWTATWEAAPGEHVLTCRAADATGREQPLKAVWNVGGYANNALQEVAVTVGTG